MIFISDLNSYRPIKIYHHNMSERDPNVSSDKPLVIMGRTIPANQVGPLLNFYEADHRLTHEDRLVLASDLLSARKEQFLSGFVFSSAALFAPSLYKSHRAKLAAKASGSPGLTLTRPTLHKPFLSVSVAVGVYFLTMYLSGRVTMDLKIQQLTRDRTNYQLSEDERESKERLLEVWKTFRPERLPLFAFYYQDTSAKPEHIMKDPRELAAQLSVGGSYSPGQPVVNSGDHTPSAWAQIRKENGFTESTNQYQSRYGSAGPNTVESFGDNESNDTFYLDESDPASKKSDTSKSDRPMSAWDRVRKGN